MQMLCSLTDGEKLEDKEMPNLDVKYLRGERDFKTWTNGRYVAANSLLILVDGENSGEVFRTLHIPADTRSAFPVISVQSPVSIQCCWQS